MNKGVDQRPIYGKYKVERTDGKPVSECFVIEEKDPQFPELINAVAAIYITTRPELSYSLRIWGLRVRNFRGATKEEGGKGEIK